MPALLFVCTRSRRLVPRSRCMRWCSIVGVLVGLEIPLVMRILKRHFSERYALKDLVAQVLTFDYLGALAVSIAFPLLLVPQLGLVRTGAFFGLLNAAVALWALWLFRARAAPRRSRMRVACAGVVASLVAAFAGAERISTWAEDRFYEGSVLYSATSPYQRVVVTASRERRAPVPERQPAVLLARRVPLSRSRSCTRRWRRTARRSACWCSAAATAWRCARC